MIYGFARAALYSNQTMKDFFIERVELPPERRRLARDRGGARDRRADEHAGRGGADDPLQPGRLPGALGVVRADQRDETLASFREVVDSVQLK